MLKKILTVLSLIIPGTIIVFAFIHLRQTQQFEENNPILAIPDNASIIIQVNNPERLKKRLSQESSFTKDLKSFDSFNTILNIISFVDTSSVFNLSSSGTIKNRPFTVSFHSNQQEQIHWIVSSPIKSRSEKNHWDRLFSQQPQANSDNNNSIYIPKNKRIPIDLGITTSKEILSFSNSKELIDESIKQRKSGKSLLDNTEFNRIQKTSITSNTASIYINYNNLSAFAAGLFNAPMLDIISGWTELSLDIRSEAIFLNGFSFSNNKEKFTSLFHGVEPGRFELDEILPATTRFLIGYTFHSTERFHDNLEAYIHQQNEGIHEPLANFKEKHGASYNELFFKIIENESALIYTDATNTNNYHKLLVFNTVGQSEASQVFELFKQKETISSRSVQYAQLDDDTRFPVYETPERETMEYFWKQLFPETPMKYYSFYRNYLVFGNTTKAIQEFMYSNILNKNLDSHPYFSSFKNNFSYQENFFLFVEIPHIFPLTNKHLNRNIFNPTNEQVTNLKNFYGIGIQMSSAGELTYTSIHADYAPHRDKEPRTIWQSRLDSAVIGKPAIVDNHNNGEKEILVQDAAYNLYLINNMGRILWKRPLEGPIMDEIYQIDYYKNNKLQYLFNTPERIYLLDRNGNHVARYPVTLPSKATNGLAVFDYNSNKEYRIFIALDNNQVYLFDKTGNRNPGWDSPRTEGIVNQTVQHFRNQGRDYIVFSDQYRNYILDRRGNIRIQLSKNFIRNKNSLFSIEGENTNNAALVTSTNKGELAKISIPSGNSSVTPVLEQPQEHYLALLERPNPGYIFITKDKLSIYNSAETKVAEVGFENPIIPHADLYRFSANDTKIGVVEQYSGNIHLINRDGTYYQGFPLKGTSRFSIGFLESTAYRFNLITGGEHNYLYNYRVE